MHYSGPVIAGRPNIAATSAKRGTQWEKAHMIPGTFDYHRPKSVAEAVKLLRKAQIGRAHV